MELKRAELGMSEDQAKALAGVVTEHAERRGGALRRFFTPGPMDKPEPRPSELERAQKRLAEAFLAGEHIIHLGQTIRAAGFYRETGMPKLAAARLGWHRCQIREGRRTTIWGPLSDSEPITFSEPIVEWPQPPAAKAGDVAPLTSAQQITGINSMMLYGIANMQVSPSGHRTHEARVPTVPSRFMSPRLREVEHLILFETEWTPVPKADPALLERITGPYYAVRASWDLTDLETKILSEMAFEG